ncbi:SIMPL domain-containing protein [Castellaniella caeni]|uniref:SIMPL domain-containing protein n=1 Tax=Castellaniella caeni TaxID=266123 RepID=UPI00083632DA|nr:SIMPL domain-containing protein [Castellaniella caeni]
MTRRTRFLMKPVLAGLLAGGLLLAPWAAQAHAPAEDSAAQASLSAQASAEVSQDTVQVTLAAEVAAASQAEVSRQLNTRLDSVMKQAKDQAGIEVSSGAYRIWPTSNQEGKIAQWRGQAEILLQSRNFAAVSQLAAQLADRMPIAGMAFSVSRERRVAEEQKLLEQSVAAFRARAGALVKALGYERYQLKSLDLGGAGDVPPMPAPRMMRAMVADAAVAAPVEGGRETLSVSVRGTIVLLPTRTDTAQ